MTSTTLFSRTDPTAVINPERMGQEFAMSTAVGGILGTGQLAGSKLADTASMKLARRGDYSGFVREMDDLIRQKKLDELMAEYEKHTDTSPVHLQETVENIGKDDMITSFQIGKSVGASAKNYPVKLPDNNQHVKFAEGQEIEGKAFAGKGTDKEIRDRFRLETTYRIPTHEWQKMSGNAYVVIDGKRKKAEIHWYSAKGKNVEMKVKRYFDED